MGMPIPGNPHQGMTLGLAPKSTLVSIRHRDFPKGDFFQKRGKGAPRDFAGG
jgi:hypothetical protein